MKVAPIYDFLRTIEWWMLSGTFALIWAFFSLSKFNYNAPHHLLRTMDWNMLSRGIQQSPLDHTYTNKQLTFLLNIFSSRNTVGVVLKIFKQTKQVQERTNKGNCYEQVLATFS